MKRRIKSGFSLLEVIAAVIILAVVAAATVATVAPMRAKSDAKLSEQQMSSLNAMCQTYFLERGAFPRSLNDLVTQGYIANVTPEERANITKINATFTYNRTTGQFARR